MILRKIIKFVATRCQILRLNSISAVAVPQTPLGELTVVWAVKLCTKKILQFLTGGTG